MFYKFKLDKDPIHTSFKDRKGRPLIPVYFQPKTANVQTTKAIEDLVNKRIFQYEKDDKFLFKRLMKLIMSDPHMAEDLRYIDEYIVCVVIKDADNLATDRDFDPVDEDLTNTENVSMYHRYIQTSVDPHHETFKEAIKVNHYEKQCVGSSLITTKTLRWVTTAEKKQTHQRKHPAINKQDGKRVHNKRRLNP